jgi:beta-lactamase superfamily II metal-dependent hydrolase
VSLIKSFSVGSGGMFYIRHNSDNFSIIDCCIGPTVANTVLQELQTQSRGKGIVRFISTHPDQDHFAGLAVLDDAMHLPNFYCVKNEATKVDSTVDFERYCQLRDDLSKAFYLFKDCSRRWMNLSSPERGTAGIDILWPVTDDPDYQEALQAAKDGESPNNISCIVRYSLQDGVKMLWMGDLETDFMDRIQSRISLPHVDVLFAPHHGRDSGKVPEGWLQEMMPGLIVIGEAPAEYINYYGGYDTITQNSTGEIMFDCVRGKTHIYVENRAYRATCLDNEGQPDNFGLHYVGTLQCSS